MAAECKASAVRPRLNIRRKLLLLSVALAVIPLLIAGRSMIRSMQDELKSSANDALVNTARQLVEEINDHYENTWLGPLRLIRNAIEDPRLGVEEKVSLLKSGVRDIADIVALQVVVEGIDKPLLATKNGFAQRLGITGEALADRLQATPEQASAWLRRPAVGADGLVYPADAGEWLLSITLPLRKGLAGRRAVLSARVSMARLSRYLVAQPLNQVGQITLMDADGRRLLGDGPEDLATLDIAQAAIAMLRSPSRSIGVAPYRRPSGETMLGAFAFAEQLPWAVLVEQDERHAYLAVSKMIESLMVWVLIGIAIAVVGAVVLATRISRPICEMDRVVREVSQGNLGVRVRGVTSRDEIGHLAQRINEMICGLTERFNLEKFVSGQTLSAVRGSDESGVMLGGERRLVTVLFSDIRGFTAFSESVEPEVVIEMLNTFLRHQAYIVKRFHGDIDKFVGDELVAVFQGDAMVANAVHCAQAIQQKIQALNDDLPEWPIQVGIGISTGEVVMGAMGSEERMDYTILGDPVNLGARLCAHAKAGETLFSAASYSHLRRSDGVQVEPLESIRVKGKARPVPVYRLGDDGQLEAETVVRSRSVAS